MTARPESMANQIANVVIRELSKIDSGTDAVKWHSRPLEVKRGGPASLSKIARPGYLVSIPDSEGTLLTATLHREKATLNIWCLADQADSVDEATEAVLHRMLDDAVQAMATNESLSGLLLFMGPARKSIEGDDAERNSFGIGRVSFDLEYEWAHGSP